MEVLAPAKINLGLEVIGKRADGYHDVATVFQAISLFDRLHLSPSDADGVRIFDRIDQIESNLALHAVELARETGLTSHSWRIDIEKRIPIAAGLGGASADAAAVLRALATCADVDDQQLLETALTLGSDVPFLLTGGAALVHGRGEVLTALPPLRGCWVVLASPVIELRRKTARLYGALSPSDFTDGARAERVASTLRAGSLPEASNLANAFERPLSELLPIVADLQRAFDRAGAPFVALSGAGPTHYTLIPELPQAIALARRLAELSPSRVRISIARPVAGGPILRGGKTHAPAEAF